VLQFRLTKVAATTKVLLLMALPIPDLASDQVSTLKRTFDHLVSSWKSDRGLIVSIEKMAMHPSYQQIIAMGPRVVPLLLAELEREPDHWFWALHVLTGVDPVPEEDSGNILKMARAWKEWGRQQGYEW